MGFEQHRLLIIATLLAGLAGSLLVIFHFILKSSKRSEVEFRRIAEQIGGKYLKGEQGCYLPQFAGTELPLFLKGGNQSLKNLIAFELNGHCCYFFWYFFYFQPFDLLNNQRLVWQSVFFVDTELDLQKVVVIRNTRIARLRRFFLERSGNNSRLNSYSKVIPANAVGEFSRGGFVLYWPHFLIPASKVEGYFGLVQAITRVMQNESPSLLEN